MYKGDDDNKNELHFIRMWISVFGLNTNEVQMSVDRVVEL